MNVANIVLRVRHAFAFALAAATLSAAEARVVYMTPEGAGAGDGTSWANAWKGADLASFNAAYTNASEGATADAPGEIWMKFGEYKFEPTDNLCFFPMQPNVIFRGGFLGTETDASAADPTNNPTVLYNNKFDVNAKWSENPGQKDPGKTWQMWARGEDGRLRFLEPPQEDDRNLYWKTDGYDQHVFVYSNEVADVGVAEFHGLTFTKFYGPTVLVETPTERPVVFRACRFLNTNWVIHNTRFAVHLKDTGVDMQDCEFVSVQSPVKVFTTSETSARRTATFRNCRFSTTRGGWNANWTGGTSAGIIALYNVALTVRGCTFDRCVAETGNLYGGAQAAMLSAWTPADVLVEDTVFSRALGFKADAGGAFSYTPIGDGSLTVRRCRFEKCRYEGDASPSHTTRAAAVTLNGDVGKVVRDARFENVAFVGNVASNTAAARATASCVSFATASGNGGYWRASFVNCLFERNEAFDFYTNGTAGATVTYSSVQRPRPVFVNCVFKDNVCGKFAADFSRTASPEVASHHGGVDDALQFAFVNTVFENTAGTAVPWNADQVGRILLANVATDADVLMTTNRSDRYRYAPLAANATIGLDDRLFTNGVVIARRLSTSSAYRKKGRPVWAGTDGEYYLYDVAGDKENPWRSCRYGGSRLTDADALAVGVSLTTAPVPDAFGTVRKVEYCGLGPLEPRQSGLLLIVR